MEISITISKIELSVSTFREEIDFGPNFDFRSKLRLSSTIAIFDQNDFRLKLRLNFDFGSQPKKSVLNENLNFDPKIEFFSYRNVGIESSILETVRQDRNFHQK